MAIIDNIACRNLTVRLARSEADRLAAQRLRWDVFRGGLDAAPETGSRLDTDPYDDICDHLLVEDDGQVVGTYRLLRKCVAEAHSGFYSSGEYNLAKLDHRAGEWLELGRSCVAPAYRDAGTIQLLWRGIASYLQEHGISMMFGCASFHGIEPFDHAAPLSYLYHNHLAPAQLRVPALDNRHVDMAMLPIGSYDQRQAMRLLPPLIKGYLRVGAMVGDGAVIDRDFNTVDVFMIMPVEQIAARYLHRFSNAA
ncbi:MAG TPA: GNAT family N-acyltransferase [Sphingorhabdus sp.]|nr:GNAT family N-acyltransferase [Sphingorhabdus sp.]